MLSRIGLPRKKSHLLRAPMTQPRSENRLVENGVASPPPFVCLLHDCPKHQMIDHRVGLYTLDATSQPAAADDSWLEGVQAYLTAQGLSKGNVRSTMSVLCRLACGEGILHPLDQDKASAPSPGRAVT